MCDKTVCNGNYGLHLAWIHIKKAATPVRNRRFFRHFLMQVPFYYYYLLQVWDGGSYAWVSRQMMCRNAFYKKQSLSVRGALCPEQGNFAVVGLPNCQAEIIRFRGTYRSTRASIARGNRY